MLISKALELDSKAFLVFIVIIMHGMSYLF